MAVQSSPSQQPLADHLRMGRNVNAEILSMSAPILIQSYHLDHVVIRIEHDRTHQNFVCV